MLADTYNNNNEFIPRGHTVYILFYYLGSLCVTLIVFIKPTRSHLTIVRTDSSLPDLLFRSYSSHFRSSYSGFSDLILLVEFP
jgi:hypothetical protein